MRFLLDNDVAVTVRRVLLDTGHECWTAAEANLHDAPDDALAVYAVDRSAACLTWSSKSDPSASSSRHRDGTRESPGAGR